MAELDVPALQQALEPLLQDQLRAHGDSGLTGHWVVLVESYDAAGRRGVVMAADPEACRWDTLGLLDYARLVEEAAEVREQLGGG